ncbi:MAG: glycosyltransferase [Bacteroidetes bacterium]|nr:glycosyltransferase [Bacteroidota bacterium]
MKILLINTYGHGGAANSCIRLHRGLLEEGIESSLLLLDDTAPVDLQSKIKFPDSPVDENVVERKGSLIEKFFKKHFPKPTALQIKKNILSRVPKQIEWFSFPDTEFEIQNHPAFLDADIINFHWASGFIDYSIFEKINKPVIWTLHDMNPFTGGCHYSGGCSEYKYECSKCPQLMGTLDDRYSKVVFGYKKKYLKDFQNLNIVSPSVWLRKCSESSALFSGFVHHTIPYGINSDVFAPRDKIAMRKKLGLPLDKVIMLFVSYKSLYIKRKGYTFLLNAISKIKNDSVCLLAVGGVSNEIHSTIPIIDFGFVNDEHTMAELYSASDFFVMPSVEDNLPNTIIEALLCGIPVTGFATGGIPDMISPGINGILAEEKSADSLYDSIMHMVENIRNYNNDEIRLDALGKYDQNIQAKKYIELYASVLKKRR